MNELYQTRKFMSPLMTTTLSVCRFTLHLIGGPDNSATVSSTSISPLFGKKNQQWQDKVYHVSSPYELAFRGFTLLPLEFWRYTFALSQAKS